MAGQQYLKMARGEETDKPYGEIRKELMAYCGLDTMAMVRLLDKLVQRFYNYEGT